MKKLFPDIKLCFTDTDSLFYRITTKDLNSDLASIKEHLDLSNYPKDHVLYDATNGTIAGFFKDETEGVPILQFCGLRAKCYSILLESDDDILDSLGVLCKKRENLNFKEQKLATAGLRSTTHSELTHERFVNTLVDNNYMNIKQRVIRSKAHNLYTVEQERIGLSAFDSKRYILYDGIHTLPYGHYRI